jgi:hypothetical protein
MAQPHIIGAHNFDAGILHISQWSGKSHQDLEHHIIPMIANTQGISAGIMKATHALLDFFYITQFPLHSNASLEILQTLHLIFHMNKNAFIANGSHAGSSNPIEHMNILKLHVLHCYMTMIWDLSTSIITAQKLESLSISSCANWLIV